MTVRTRSFGQRSFVKGQISDDQSSSGCCRSLKVWNLKLLKEGKVPPVGGMHFNICTAYPQEKYIVTSQGWMKSCAILADDKPLGRSIGHDGFIKKAEFSADGKKLVTLDTGHSGAYEVMATMVSLYFLWRDLVAIDAGESLNGNASVIDLKHFVTFTGPCPFNCLGQKWI